MGVRKAARNRERWSENDVCGAAWKAALQNLSGRSPKVRKIAAPQGLFRRAPSYKVVDRARSAVGIVRETGLHAHNQEWLCHSRAGRRV